VASFSNIGSFNAGGTSWCLDGLGGLGANQQLIPSNIVNGLLYQYNTQVGIYHCPADYSELVDLNGNLLPQSRWRSYNMSQSVNGVPGFAPQGFPDWLVQFFQSVPAWSKFAQIHNPIPSELFVFIDENENTIIDGQFGNPGNPLYAPFETIPDQWWDMPANRHNQGANLSFADGHVEHWKWKAPEIYNETPQSGAAQDVTDNDEPDYVRIQNAMRQCTDN
jgi:prepilin-type processing-associated H-X9-DG protein